MASSSTTSTAQEANNDVFLSFRSKDTRNNITNDLYAALTQQRITTFIVEKSDRQKEISLSLQKTIEESHISVIIFSENYASSNWCLKELEKILQCKKIYGRTVIPVFYHVDRSHVRLETDTSRKAFGKHEANSTPEKVNNWARALKEAANLPGFHVDGTRSETSFVEAIVGAISRKLISMCRRVEEDFVGLESRTEEINRLLPTSSEDVFRLGIWGMGGIGKTTLASAIFYKMSGKFESSCFIYNVREESEVRGGLTILKQKLISRLKYDDTIDSGLIETKERLGLKKFLVVLDDVTKLTQIDFLIGGLVFGLGSLIVITTRDRRVLHSFGVDKIHEVKGLSRDEVVMLLSGYALKKNYPIKGEADLSESILEYGQGLPLALKVLGTCLFGSVKEQWKSILHNLRRNLPTVIYEVLKVSYDGLDEDEQFIFQKIVSSLETHNINTVIKTLSASPYSAKEEIDDLIEKSLLAVRSDTITMHDLVQQMGIKIKESLEHHNNPKKQRVSETHDPDEISCALENGL